ncbi:MAG: hypothetical protein M0R33_18815 [Methylomonas sp.]|jgi:hypothetical protein|uniref:hypothetical protein n=1 Tax=Methylomonas sp. TaxID=418 RepID=UPI0025DE7754|nr:hypothetical protein [Methylomonas sp.]MCK9608497.1 hypothetical protein [Methylomonas sp.]
MAITPPINFTEEYYFAEVWGPGAAAITAIPPLAYNTITQILTIGDASAVNRGTVSIAAQSFAGMKTFNDGVRSLVAPATDDDLTRKKYVDDAIESLILHDSYKQAILNFYDASGGLPVAPAVGDRYCCSVAGFGWNQWSIYEYLADLTWFEDAPAEGDTVFDKTTKLLYTYELVPAVGYVHSGNTMQHQDLVGAGTLTHATIDSYLDQTVKIAATPTFAALTAKSATPIFTFANAGVSDVTTTFSLDVANGILGIDQSTGTDVTKRNSGLRLANAAPLSFTGTNGYVAFNGTFLNGVWTSANGGIGTSLLNLQASRIDFMTGAIAPGVPITHASLIPGSFAIYSPDGTKDITFAIDDAGASMLTTTNNLLRFDGDFNLHFPASAVIYTNLATDAGGNLNITPTGNNIITTKYFVANSIHLGSIANTNGYISFDGYYDAFDVWQWDHVAPGRLASIVELLPSEIDFLANSVDSTAPTKVASFAPANFSLFAKDDIARNVQISIADVTGQVTITPTYATRFSIEAVLFASAFDSYMSQFRVGTSYGVLTYYGKINFADGTWILPEDLSPAQKGSYIKMIPEPAIYFALAAVANTLPTEIASVIPDGLRVILGGTYLTSNAARGVLSFNGFIDAADVWTTNNAALQTSLIMMLPGEIDFNASSVINVYPTTVATITPLGFHIKTRLHQDASNARGILSFAGLYDGGGVWADDDPFVKASYTQLSPGAIQFAIGFAVGVEPITKFDISDVGIRVYDNNDIARYCTIQSATANLTITSPGTVPAGGCTTIKSTLLIENYATSQQATLSTTAATELNCDKPFVCASIGFGAQVGRLSNYYNPAGIPLKWTGPWGVGTTKDTTLTIERNGFCVHLKATFVTGVATAAAIATLRTNDDTADYDLAAEYTPAQDKYIPLSGVFDNAAYVFGTCVVSNTSHVTVRVGANPTGGAFAGAGNAAFVIDVCYFI